MKSKEHKRNTSDSENFKLPNGIDDEHGDHSTGQGKSSVEDNGAFKLPGDITDNS